MTVKSQLHVCVATESVCASVHGCRVAPAPESMAARPQPRLSAWLLGHSCASVHGLAHVRPAGHVPLPCQCKHTVFYRRGRRFQKHNARSQFSLLFSSRILGPKSVVSAIPWDTPIGQPSAQGRPMAIPGALPLGSPTRRVAQRASEGAARQTPGQLNSRTSATLHRNAPYTCARKKLSAGTSTEEHRGTVGWQRARGLSSVCSVSQSVTHSKLRSLPCP